MTEQALEQALVRAERALARSKRAADNLSRRGSREESLQTDKRRASSIAAHRRIIAAVEKHDRSKARSEMLRHIEQVEDSVLLSKPLGKKRDQHGRERKIA